MSGPDPTAALSSASEDLGAFIHGLEFSRLPLNIVGLTRLRVIDALGAAFAGHTSDISRRLLAHPPQSTGGASRVWMSGTRGDAAEVAFANSVLVHSVLMEDVGLGGHPSANVIPVALAVGEEVGATGAQVMTAVSAGYEIQTRVAAGRAVYKSIGDRGLRGTTVTGAFGAAATAAKLYGLSTEQCASALAFAASLGTPGIEQPILEGTDERCIQMANNTRAGVVSARLARDGFRGARYAMEGDCGFYSAYMAMAEPPGLRAALGTRWVSTMQDLFFKAHPTAGMNVGPIYAVEMLLKEGSIVADDLSRIKSIAVLQKWWRVNTAYLHPGPFDTFEQAILSSPLAVATTLLFGAYTVETLTQAMSDPRALDLARKVTVDGVATWSIVQGVVTITLGDGRRVVRTAEDMPRAVYDPTWDEGVEKFGPQAASAVTPEAGEAIVNSVAQLESLPGVDGLVTLTIRR